jgi:hypothetical protein
MAIVVKGIGISDALAVEQAKAHRPLCTECGARPVRIIILAVGVEVEGMIPCMPIAACADHLVKLEAFEDDAVNELAKRIGGAK